MTNPTPRDSAQLSPADFIADLTKSWEGPWASAADTIIQALRVQAASVEPVGEVHSSWNDDEGLMLVKRTGAALPIGTKLYTGAQPALARESALVAERDALRAALAQWLPIEQAPKDELYNDGESRYAAHILAWYPGALAPMRVRWWWREDTGACNFLTDGGYAVFPTMFQALPAPPALAAPAVEG